MPTDPKTILGAYVGPAGSAYGPNQLPLYETWLGRDVTWAHEFFTASENWSNWYIASWYHTHTKAQGGWLEYADRLFMSVPMGVAHDHTDWDTRFTGPPSELNKGARGDYDAHFTAMAEDFVTAGYPSVPLRLGWEFNGYFGAGYIGNYHVQGEAVDIDPASPTFNQTLPKSTFFKRFWIRIVNVMRAVTGADFTFVWCPTIGDQFDNFVGGYVNPENSYPGDAYVDVIALDVYNQSWTTNDPEARWTEMLNGNNGVQWVVDFADGSGTPTGVRNGLGVKQLGFSEWGTGTRHGETAGGEDDPLFIANMYDIMADNDVHHAIYWEWDSGELGTSLSPFLDGETTRPNASAEFLSLFGGAGGEGPPGETVGEYWGVLA